MPTPLDIRKIRCFDGLHYSFQLLKHYHADLWKTCCAIQADNTQAIPALAACWGFIDALHRIREIVQATPGLKSKDPEMRLFLTATSLAESYRHYIQHLRGELSKEPPNTFPVWGSLSWVDENDTKISYIAILGAQTPGTDYVGCVYDTIQNRWVSKVCLSVDNHSFNFDQILDSALRFEKFIHHYLIQIASDEVQLRDKLPIFTVKITLPAENA